MAYADLTVNDPNPVKQWLQRRRIRDALRALRASPPGGSASILDYGGGDGRLLQEALAHRRFAAAWLFEPTPDLIEEARRVLATHAEVRFARSIAEIGEQKFEWIFCLEVFEHLPPEQTDQAIAAIHRLLSPGATAVIGVPNELWLAALLKGVFRMVRRYGSFDARPSLVLRAALGYPTGERPVWEITPGHPYYPHHLGFDYRRLEHHLLGRFEILETWASPFRWMGRALASELYYSVRAK